VTFAPGAVDTSLPNAAAPASAVQANAAGMIEIVLVAATVHVGHGTGVATLTKSAARGEVGDVLTVPAGVKVLTAK